VSAHPSAGNAAGGVNDLDDRQLAELAVNDRDALSTLYRRHVGAVYAHAYRLSGSKEVAEEATSATFERAMAALPRFRWDRGGLRPWLLVIAGNEVAACYRRTNRDRSPRAQMAFRDLVVIDAQHDASHERLMAEVRRALPRLPQHYREVIELRYLAGVEPAAAAAALGCSKAALAVTLHRALGALRRELTLATAQGVSGSTAVGSVSGRKP
jgi:RNA polymerase sigma factor (sigma-70 family)